MKPHLHLSKADPKLKPVIKKAGPYAIKGERGVSPYEALVTSVVYQQLAGKVANIIFNRMLDIFPGKKFPTPKQIIETPDEKFRAAGLSRTKLATIKEIARHTLEGIVPDRSQAKRLSDEELVQRLTVIKGVGPWTVHMLLIFTLGRPDVFPSTDYGVRKGFAKIYGKRELPHPKKLLLISEKWKPFRSAAAWYFWQALDLD